MARARPLPGPARATSLLQLGCVYRVFTFTFASLPLPQPPLHSKFADSSRYRGKAETAPGFQDQNQDQDQDQDRASLISLPA